MAVEDRESDGCCMVGYSLPGGRSVFQVIAGAGDAIGVDPPLRWMGLAAAGDEIDAVSPLESPLKGEKVVERQCARAGQREGESRRPEKQHQLHPAVPGEEPIGP